MSKRPTDSANGEQAAPRRQVRSTKLIAEFADGFAVGWKMAVSPAFKAALDIRFTQRIVRREPVMTWTQGPLFAFQAGDVLYDSRITGRDWTQTLPEFRIGVQVVHASPVRYLRGRLDPGAVKFRVMRPDAERATILECETIECSQHSFVEFLRTGVVDAIDVGKVDLLAPDRPTPTQAHLDF